MPGLTLEIGLHEAVLIGDSTTVTVQRIRRDKVRLNIVAPRETRVDRMEVAVRREIEQQIAAGANLRDLEDQADLQENLNANRKKYIREDTGLSLYDGS